MPSSDQVIPFIRELILTGFDVYSDVNMGIIHQEEKNVTRTFLANDTVPNYCIALTNSTAECREKDPVWAAITFGCIQLPAVVLVLCTAVGMLLFRCGPGGKDAMKNAPGYKKVLAGCLLLLVIPFPFVTIVSSAISLCSSRLDAQMQWLGPIFTVGEESLESSPQLLLQLYIIASDSEKPFSMDELGCITFSLLMIFYGAIKIFVSESYIFPDPDALHHRETLNDSLMKGKDLLMKHYIFFKISPAFISSFLFKVGSLTIICAYLKAYALIYLASGVVITFIAAYTSFKYGSMFGRDQKVGSALFYSLTNITILSMCPMNGRKLNYPQMVAVSATWWVLHSAMLVSLMIWAGALPESTHLDHWSEPRFALHSDLFGPIGLYLAVLLILFFGPLSLMCLWDLKNKVKAFEREEAGGRKFWEALYGNPDPVELD